MTAGRVSDPTLADCIEYQSFIVSGRGAENKSLTAETERRILCYLRSIEKARWATMRWPDYATPLLFSLPRLLLTDEGYDSVLFEAHLKDPTIRGKVYDLVDVEEPKP